VRAHLDVVCSQPILVVYHSVVRRFDVPLQAGVCLEVEIEIKHPCYTFVDDGARTGVAILVSELRVGREKFGVVTLSINGC